MDWRDRTIGIVLGVVLGVGIVVAFVFLLSERTVDAPSLSTEHLAAGGNRGAQDQPKGEHRSRPPQPAPPVETVRVVAGAPPPSGPAELRYTRGELIRLKVISDTALTLELTGYGLTRAVVADQPTKIDVEASQAGAFALVVADSHIDIARITVAAPNR